MTASSRPPLKRGQTIWRALNHLLYVVAVSCALVVVPTSFGFSLPQLDFEDIVTERVGEELGQELNISSYDYVQKFNPKEYRAYQGYIDLDQFKGMTPMEMWAEQTRMVTDYEEKLNGQLYLRKMADNYQRVGKMKVEQYKLLYEKYKLQAKNFDIKRVGNIARKVFTRMKFLAK